MRLFFGLTQYIAFLLKEKFGVVVSEVWGIPYAIGEY